MHHYVALLDCIKYTCLVQISCADHKIGHNSNTMVENIRCLSQGDNGFTSFGCDVSLQNLPAF